MDEITVGVLTVSDSCSRKEAADESGPNLVEMIQEGVVKKGRVLKIGLVPDCKKTIEKVLKDWCEEGINLILTTGGTGVSKRDVTPEATMALSDKLLPGMSQLMFKRSSDVTPLAALSRAVAGVRRETLIINLPGSKKASQECLEAVARVIPHAVHLITDKKAKVRVVHTSLIAKKSSVVPGGATAIKRASPYPCVSVSEAQETIILRVHLLRKEKFIEYDRAYGYVLAEDVAAKDSLPPFDASIKDGYAVIACEKVQTREVIGVSNAGDSSVLSTVVPGTCVRVSTGAAIPPGADAVVEVEGTSLPPGSGSDPKKEIIILKKNPQKGQDIRLKGSDFNEGERLLKYGSYLDAAALGVLAAAGVTSVRVFDKPIVAVMSTGNELVNPKENLKPGKVRDSNRITLINLLKEENFEAVDLGIVVDTPDALRNSLESGFRKADIVVTSGSMSMGERDYLKEVLISDFGAEIFFGRIWLKPGKPTACGILTFEDKHKLWFGLPGNPASAFVTFHIILLPALKLIAGLEKVLPTRLEAHLKEQVCAEERPQFVRGVLTYSEEERWVASVLKRQRSSSIRGCVNANCLVEVPSTTDLQKICNIDRAKVWLIGKI